MLTEGFFLQAITSKFVEQSETYEARGDVFQQGRVCAGCGSVHTHVFVCGLCTYGQTPDETDLYPRHAGVHQGAPAALCPVIG